MPREKRYVKAGDVVTVTGKGTEAGAYMGITGRQIEVEVRAYEYPHHDGVYPVILSEHHPLTSPSMGEVAFYLDDGGWFFWADTD
ncbi:UNVERIFIED_ORG: hypothetical protein FHR35_009158 [Microbispora rosea subsp. rosea]